MQLYVLGPAFRLPSIDAECNAASALLRSQIGETGWSIRSTHDVAQRLPHLVDGDQHFHGFSNIVRHLQKRCSFDQPLDDTQRADLTALTSFLNTHAQLLLDISLYVSFENYTTTRSAFTKILPWHANYMLPPRLREAARKRTEHLGISSIDVDDVHDDLSNKPQGFDTSVGQEKKFEAETQKRASLLLQQRNTVRGLLQQKQGSAVFKLHALADNFFEVLSELLGEKEYFIGDHAPTAADYLAYGYLSLMLYPQLPQDWLSKTMSSKYPNLARFTRRIHDGCSLATNETDVMRLASCKSAQDVTQYRAGHKMALPWESPVYSGPLEVCSSIATDVLSRIPLLAPKTPILDSKHHGLKLWHTYWLTLALTSAVTMAGCGYMAFTTGMVVWPHGEAVHIFGRRRLADYGHLGAALAGFGMLGQQASNGG